MTEPPSSAPATPYPGMCGRSRRGRRPAPVVVGRGAAHRGAALLGRHVGPGGAPHVMPLWAIWLDGSVWFSTGTGSRKARNLRADPRCAVHTDGEDPVVVNGVAEFVTEPSEVARMSESYVRKYPAPPPDPSENPIVRVRPRVVIGLVEAQFSTSPTRWTFED